MKSKFIAAIMILSLVVLVTSCATNRKYGCPMAKTTSKSLNS